MRTRKKNVYTSENGEEEELQRSDWGDEDEWRKKGTALTTRLKETPRVSQYTGSFSSSTTTSPKRAQRTPLRLSQRRICEAMELDRIRKGGGVLFCQEDTASSGTKAFAIEQTQKNQRKIGFPNGGRCFCEKKRTKGECLYGAMTTVNPNA